MSDTIFINESFVLRYKHRKLGLRRTWLETHIFTAETRSQVNRHTTAQDTRQREREKQETCGHTLNKCSCKTIVGKPYKRMDGKEKIPTCFRILSVQFKGIKHFGRRERNKGKNHFSFVIEKKAKQMSLVFMERKKNPKKRQKNYKGRICMYC